MTRALTNFAVAFIRKTLSLPGEDFYRRASRAIARGLWQEQWKYEGKHAAFANSVANVVIHPADIGNGQSVDMLCVGDKALLRARKILTKEPSTIAWLDRMSADDVLWDIGANVGVYTLYAAVRHGCRVLAIEPGAANYYLLNKNIEINRLSGRVTALCAAAAGKAGFGFLNLPNTAPGEAFTSYDDKRGGDGGFQQGMIGITLDELSGQGSFPPPTFIKIDVDGIEHDIVRGARSLLQSGQVRSVLIERDIGRQDLIAQMDDEMAALSFRRVESGVRADRTPSVVNCIYDR
jgi:FkbM family methyltransferase